MALEVNIERDQGSDMTFGSTRMILLLSALLLLQADVAWAYIDPGAGMAAIQTIGALIGAALAFSRAPFRWLKRRLSARQKP